MRMDRIFFLLLLRWGLRRARQVFLSRSLRSMVARHGVMGVRLYLLRCDSLFCEAIEAIEVSDVIEEMDVVQGVLCAG